MTFQACNQFTMTFALLAGLCMSSRVVAQDDDEAASLAKAHQQFRAVLDQTDDILYKTNDDGDGNKFYTVMWENGEDSLRYVVFLDKLGFYDSRDIYSLKCVTRVAVSENSFPPAVIKAVATTNDKVTLGNFSCSEDFTGVYASLPASLDGLTPGTMWLYSAYLHSNTVGMKEIIDEAITASGR